MSFTAVYLLGKKNKAYKKSFFICLIATVIQVTGTYITTSIMEYLTILDKLFTSRVGMLISYILLGVIVVFLSVLIFKIVDLTDIDYLDNGIYINSIIIIFLVFCSIVYYNIYFLNAGWVSDTQKTSVIIILISLIVILALIVATKGFYNDRELRKRNEELRDLQNYIADTEEAYLEMRKFKHDYTNIISSLAGYIFEDDNDGLKKYFKKNIMPLTESFENKRLKITSIKRIVIPEIKGIFLIKSIHAQEKGIEVSVEVDENIDYIEWDILSACKSIGILLDNAIEAAIDSTNKELNLAFIKKEDKVMIIIRNSYTGEKPNIKEIFIKGYSTKGQKRGLGLYILKENIYKQRNIILDTRIDENYFTQIINIY
ncbi:MAG: sensor histidine kinase [Clostridium chrysemydis]|uniref:sensor histidine kinase n=1 Tax=Clostridium chrysemydis TaxID=2665504 RepID=UPI003F2FFC45